MRTDRWIRRLWALMLAVMLASMAMMTAGALAASQYRNWEEIADAIDGVLDGAVEAYRNGDADGAYKGVNSGYFDYYEVTGMERITLGYIGSARKGQVELQFSAAKSAAKKGATVDAFVEQ